MVGGFFGNSHTQFKTPPTWWFKHLVSQWILRWVIGCKDLSYNQKLKTEIYVKFDVLLVGCNDKLETEVFRI